MNLGRRLGKLEAQLPPVNIDRVADIMMRNARAKSLDSDAPEEPVPYHQGMVTANDLIGAAIRAKG